MSITLAEVVCGVVAYFDVVMLNADARVTKPAAPTPRNGPFMCFEVDDYRSGWAPLTWQSKVERIEIEPAWRTGGTEAWKKNTPYLNDGATTYVGPTEAFVDAARSADTYRTETRQFVSAAGVTAVLSEINRRGGRRL